jgi:glucosamine--fructose-6-phosphate aminotransferase (isomerizing)
MCGIIAVLRRPSERPAPDPADVLAAVDRAAALVTADEASLRSAAAELTEVNRLLGGVPGVCTLLDNPDLSAAIKARAGAVAHAVQAIEADLDQGARPATEDVNAAIVDIKDGLWAITRDRLRTAAEVAGLAGPNPSPAAVAAMTSVQVALSALDRLEVRGRDSAGLHLFVTGHGIDPADAELAERRTDPLFTSGAVRMAGPCLSFVYKAAAEIGELGDNTRTLRTAIANDSLLRRALAAPTAEAVVLGHTRWASVGIISEANAHPLNSEEVEGSGRQPYVVGALNGDVDNYAELTEQEQLRIAGEVTTDAKVIPMLVSRRLAGGADLADSFRQTVARFEGSVAIAAAAADAPERLLLAQRRSGQGMYVGLAEDAFVVASEPYGVVEETSRYVRLDGEAVTESGSQGQVMVLDKALAGTLQGMDRRAYDGTPIPVVEAAVSTAEITTRDIDRAGYPHFLLKELGEAPQSFRKTLRGKIAESDDGRLTVSLGDATLPPSVRDRLRTGAVRRVYVIGQGTAAVAGQGVAAALTDALAQSAIRVSPLPATELSGFALDDDMSDALVVAISQSGTTTDTNRTVDMVRSRGAAVVAIVNRRNSDLVEKSDGVLYTSDGRDVEMSVASTKAFYAQIAAGMLLSLAVAREVGGADPNREHDLLVGLRELPGAMDQVLAKRDEIGRAAQAAPSRRSWAVVGNGQNRIAAEEIRIKLSELCYKSIACDATEDKKHIDLSTEPLILVCATGLDGANADDAAKEVAIFRAHKAAPVVIATEGMGRFAAALSLIEVPRVHPDLAFVLSAAVGHLFGYEAALAIDGQALILREARAAIESLVGLEDDPDRYLERLRDLIQVPAGRFFAALRAGELNGNLEASTAERVASLLRYTAGIVPLEAYQVEYGKVGTPAVLIEDLTTALTHAIEELTRPIDAIKHQAKTVTVGISRSEEVLFRAPLVAEVLAAGASRDRLSYKALRTLGNLGPAVRAVNGYTRYRIDGRFISVIDKGGVAQSIPSRTEGNRELRATVTSRSKTARCLVPEIKDNEVTGMTLLHVDLADTLPPDAARGVLMGYRGRYQALVDAVTETEPAFDDVRLAEVPFVDLMVEPVHVLARRWRS